jgi:tRNA threonylcarbamoyladenosine biosynthesis protein TsaB
MHYCTQPCAVHTMSHYSAGVSPVPDILALDTSTDACSVALLQGGQVTYRSELIPRQHSQRLFSMLREVLPSGNLRQQGVGLLAYNQGPGSFTGLRIAASAVQGLAYSNQLPVAGVSTLACLALGAARKAELPDGALLMPLLDARINEVYWGLYRYRAGTVEAVHQDSVCAPGELPLGEWSELYAVGSGLKYRAEFPAVFSERISDTSPDLWPDARDLLTLAAGCYAAGNLLQADQVHPVYVRDEIGWKKLSEQGG